MTTKKTTLKKKAAPKKAAPEVAPVTTVELQLTDGILDYSDIWAFVQKHAGGQEGNVRIVPLENVDLTSAEPVPFGYGGNIKEKKVPHYLRWQLEQSFWELDFCLWQKLVMMLFNMETKLL